MSFYKIVFPVVLLTSTAPSFAAGCHVDPFTGQFGSDTDVHMVAKAGQPCTIRMSNGATAGISISGQAQHGIASVNESRIVYTPSRGYSGSDRFVFERTGESFSSKRGTHFKGTSHYMVDVEVSP